MKKIFLVFAALLCMGPLSFGETRVTLKWDPNTEQDLAGYNVYQSDTPDGEVLSKDGGTPVETVLVTDADPTRAAVIVPDGVWYWKLTAFDISGNESIFSLEAFYDTGDTMAPGGPGGFQVEKAEKT